MAPISFCLDPSALNPGILLRHPGWRRLLPDCERRAGRGVGLGVPVLRHGRPRRRLVRTLDAARSRRTRRQSEVGIKDINAWLYTAAPVPINHVIKANRSAKVLTDRVGLVSVYQPTLLAGVLWISVLS